MYSHTLPDARVFVNLQTDNFFEFHHKKNIFCVILVNYQFTNAQFLSISKVDSFANPALPQPSLNPPSTHLNPTMKPNIHPVNPYGVRCVTYGGRLIATLSKEKSYDRPALYGLAWLTGRFEWLNTFEEVKNAVSQYQ